MTGVYVTPPVLSGPNGATIPGGDGRLYREGYQNITTPSNTEGGTGLWPDPLIPDVDETMNEKRNAFPFDVPSGENRVVWVDVHVPQSQQIGWYQGTVTVQGTGLGTVSVPVKLLVWDFALPSTASLASTFGMGWDTACIAFYGSYEACGNTGVEQTHLMFGRFMLDSGRRRLSRKDREISLSRKAFDLLVVLLERRPNVVDKETLLASIWPDANVIEANLNVLVSEIRAALVDNPRRARFIQTIHGIGFAFCGDASEADESVKRGKEEGELSYPAKTISNVTQPESATIFNTADLPVSHNR